MFISIRLFGKVHTDTLCKFVVYSWVLFYEGEKISLCCERLNKSDILGHMTN